MTMTPLQTASGAFPPARFRATLLGGLLILLIVGCGATSHREPDWEVIDHMRRTLEAKVNRMTNIKPRPADQPAPPTLPPAFSQEAEQVVLADLGLVLRKVVFEEPMDGRPFLFFAETETTNEMFLAYLNATNQWRDDSELEAAEAMRWQSIVTPEGYTASIGGSTASLSINIHQKELLWREGTFPAGLGNHPVTFVATDQVMDFCKWLTARYDLPGTFRLPTNEEWLFAAYGTDRYFPWGDDEREWAADSTEPVHSRPDLRTPDGLYGMWGNAAELVGSRWNGYGGKLAQGQGPMTTTWLGMSYREQAIPGSLKHIRKDYWGYSHSTKSRSDDWGFRIVFVPGLCLCQDNE